MRLNALWSVSMLWLVTSVGVSCARHWGGSKQRWFSEELGLRCEPPGGHSKKVVQEQNGWSLPGGSGESVNNRVWSPHFLNRVAPADTPLVGLPLAVGQLNQLCHLATFLEYSPWFGAAVQHHGKNNPQGSPFRITTCLDPTYHDAMMCELNLLSGITTPCYSCQWKGWMSLRKTCWDCLLKKCHYFCVCVKKLQSNLLLRWMKPISQSGMDYSVPYHPCRNLICFSSVTLAQY